MPVEHRAEPEIIFLSEPGTVARASRRGYGMLERFEDSVEVDEEGEVERSPGARSVIVRMKAGLMSRESALRRGRLRRWLFGVDSRLSRLCFFMSLRRGWYA
jgi:hypothetical protein